MATDTRVDIPYVIELPGTVNLSHDAPGTQTHMFGAVEYSVIGTLTKNTWLAQEEKQKVVQPSPSSLNILLAFISFFFCPFLGILAIIYSIEAKVVHREGKFSEAEAYCYRSRGTAFYAIAVGVGLGLGMGLLLGLGDRFNWY